jgi:lipopolysaccharide transport system ATP-binding protein
MTSDVVIRAEGLGKKYIIGHEVERNGYTTFREVAARTARDAWGRVADAARGRAIVRGEATEEFWALKDVSFEVKRGEVLGIIGRNGAGKSTLLKILSRITEPTQGHVTIIGRVASLLEVGTGFHPELTGRENIYLNGAILGMSRAEIRRKFDEIVDFSGVEKFIDTPVKRYSSGMQVRLAFSVAAHLEPEILVVDEVLAVGDAQFQKKCLGKMGEVSTREGRTVLFVSHQLGMVARLCNRAMLLSGGALTKADDTRDVLDAYRREVEVLSTTSRIGSAAHGTHISHIATFDRNGEPSSEFFFDEEITVRATISGDITDPGTLLSTTLVSRNGDYVSTTTTPLHELIGRLGRTHSISVVFPSGVIAPNEYYFRLALFIPRFKILDLHELVAPIKLRDAGSSMSAFEGVAYGHVILPCRTEIAKNDY